MCSTNTFIQVLGLTEVLTVLQCSLKSPYTNSQIYPGGISFLTTSRFLHRPAFLRTGLRTGLRTRPHRSGPRLAQPIRPMLSLALNTPPQAQLEALPDLSDHHSSSYWLHASLSLLDMFNSVHFDPSGQLVCSHGPSQLPCCCGVGASLATFSSTWPLVDPAYPNQTS